MPLKAHVPGRGGGGGGLQRLLQASCPRGDVLSGVARPASVPLDDEEEWLSLANPRLLEARSTPQRGEDRTDQRAVFNSGPPGISKPAGERGGQFLLITSCRADTAARHRHREGRLAPQRLPAKILPSAACNPRRNGLSRCVVTAGDALQAGSSSACRSPGHGICWVSSACRASAAALNNWCLQPHYERAGQRALAVERSDRVGHHLSLGVSRRGGVTTGRNHNLCWRLRTPRSPRPQYPSGFFAKFAGGNPRRKKAPFRDLRS